MLYVLPGGLTCLKPNSTRIGTIINITQIFLINACPQKAPLKLYSPVYPLGRNAFAGQSREASKDIDVRPEDGRLGRRPLLGQRGLARPGPLVSGRTKVQGVHSGCKHCDKNVDGTGRSIQEAWSIGTVVIHVKIRRDPSQFFSQNFLITFIFF